MTDISQLPTRLTDAQQVPASGVLEISFGPRALVVWVVSQVSIEMADAPSGSAAFLRLRDTLVSPLVPTGDAASGDPPVTLYPGDELSVQWTGVTPGSTGKVFVIYNRVDFS